MHTYALTEVFNNHSGQSGMCRLAAYLGPEILLERFLTAPSHSLVVQAYAPKELKFAKLNADGFGFAWFDATNTTSRYVNAMPIWSDINLPSLARSLQSRLWIASVRSATPGFASGAMNTHPFCTGGYCYTHNGYLDHFGERARPALIRELRAEVTTDLCGNTDSEYLFALLRHLRLERPEYSMEAIIAEAFERVAHWQAGATALLNIAISDGQTLYATRHAVNGESPSLYFNIAAAEFPAGGQLLASERLTPADPNWQAVPDHHILVMTEHAEPRLIAL